MKFDLYEVFVLFSLSCGIFVCLVGLLGVWGILDGMLTMKLIITASIIIFVAVCTLAIRE